MKVKFGTGSRITIPKEIVNEYNLKEGEYLELRIINNKLELSRGITDIENNKEDVNKKENSIKNNITSNLNIVKSKIEIKSNIDEKDKYAKPILSDCGQVVRSKRKYLKEFCEVCKGQLSADSACPYNVQSPKKLAQEINKKVELLNKKLDEKIEKTTMRSKDTTIQPIATKDLQRCNKCHSLVFKGFLVDDTFLCTQCTCEDFREFYKTYYNGGNR